MLGSRECGKFWLPHWKEIFLFIVTWEMIKKVLVFFWKSWSYLLLFRIFWSNPFFFFFLIEFFQVDQGLLWGLQSMSFKVNPTFTSTKLSRMFDNLPISWCQNLTRTVHTTQLTLHSQAWLTSQLPNARRSLGLSHSELRTTPIPPVLKVNTQFLKCLLLNGVRLLPPALRIDWRNYHQRGKKKQEKKEGKKEKLSSKGARYKASRRVSCWRQDKMASTHI